MEKHLIVLMLLLPPLLLSPQNRADDTWKILRFLEGTWEGKGEGISGVSSVTQEYQFILNGQFLRMTTKSVFEPQEKNQKGEIHEDIGIFSFDKSRKVFVLRTFYVEGFVNQYVYKPLIEAGESMEFFTESVENAPPGTKAKLVFRRLGDNEIEQSFHVAFPGREYSCYSRNMLKRRS